MAGTEASRERARERLGAAGVAVLHEDNHLLVLDKPAGLASQGGPDIDESAVSLVDAYRREAEQKPGRAFVGLVHRLDRNVSGVLLVAKTSKAARRLAEVFRERRPPLRKEYVAWVSGRPGAAEGELVHRLRRDGRMTRETFTGDPEGREATLHYVVEGNGRKSARLGIVLGTGLPHQIRAQLSLAGCALVGDVKYGGPKGARPALHARRLVIPHPVGGETLTVEAPLPADLRALDRRLAMDPRYGA